MNNQIDIIIPWVDENDENWQREKLKWMQKKDIPADANSNIRYQGWDNLHILFRGIEKFMPWVHKVFLVTCGHIPEFLDIDNPKLELIKHDSYIPQKYLPTFNSNTIEMNYHRIKNLSENFILFNDDTFPVSPIEESYYFQDNVVCEEAVETPVMPTDIGQITQYSCILKVNNMLLINKHFNKRQVQKENYGKWFCEDYGELLERTKGLQYWNNFVGFHDRHMPVAVKKSTLAHLWEIEPDVLDCASSNKFRNFSDVSQYLIRYWQICEGNFCPRKTLGEPYFVTIDNYKKVVEDMVKNKHQMVCFIEDCTSDEFLIIKKEINKALESILPQKSSFEK